MRNGLLFEDLDALAGKTRVLVTHAVHFAHHADCIVVVADGRIKATGTLAELRGYL